MIWFRKAFVSFDGEMVSADHASGQATASPWPRIIVASAMACNLLAKRGLGVKGRHGIEIGHLDRQPA